MLFSNDVNRGVWADGLMAQCTRFRGIVSAHTLFILCFFIQYTHVYQGLFLCFSLQCFLSDSHDYVAQKSSF